MRDFTSVATPLPESSKNRDTICLFLAVLGKASAAKADNMAEVSVTNLKTV